MLKWGEALGISAGGGKTTVSRFDFDESKSGWAFGVGDGVFLVPFRSNSNGCWRVTVLPIGDTAKSIVKAEVEPGSMITINGLPHMFAAKLTYQDNRTRNLRLRSSDRFDREALLRKESIHLLGGYYPTITLGLLGTVGAGKSCYQHSLCINSTLERAGKLLGGKVISTAKDPKTARLPRTSVSSFEGVPFELTKEDGKKVRKTEVVVFDMGGELSMLENHNQSVFTHERYRMNDRLLVDEVLDKARFLDGVLVVVKGSSLLENAKRPLGDIEGLLRLFSEENGNIWKIVAVSEADVIQDKLSEAEAAYAYPSVLANGTRLHSTSPVFNAVHNMEDLRRHMALAADVLRDTHRYSFSEDMPVCFTATCCEESGDMLDFQKGFNQELPFVWLVQHIVDMGGKHHES